LVEHFLGKEEVTGSIPVISSAKNFDPVKAPVISVGGRNTGNYIIKIEEVK
jgi:hypothetical protein